MTCQFLGGRVVATRRPAHRDVATARPALHHSLVRGGSGLVFDNMSDEMRRGHSRLFPAIAGFSRLFPARSGYPGYLLCGPLVVSFVAALVASFVVPFLVHLLLHLLLPLLLHLRTLGVIPGYPLLLSAIPGSPRLSPVTSCAVRLLFPLLLHLLLQLLLPWLSICCFICFCLCCST